MIELGQIATLLGLISVGIWIYFDQKAESKEPRAKSVEPRAKN